MGRMDRTLATPLIYMDLDGLQLMSDSCGHLEGDRTLVVPGKRVFLFLVNS